MSPSHTCAEGIGQNIANYFNEMIIRTLLCERDVEMAIRCLGSYFAFAEGGKDDQLVIHNDGSLTTESISRLKATLPVHTVVSRDQADEVVQPLLSKCPSLQVWRSRKATMMKIIDCVAFETRDGNPDGYMRFLDSDILFTRPFSGLFQTNPSHDAQFMKDIHQAFCIPPKRALSARVFPLVSKLNSGVIEAKVSKISISKMEEFASDPLMVSHPMRVTFLEQTLWAKLFENSVVKQVAPSQLVLITTNHEQDSTAIGGHFVTGTRHLLDQWKNSPEIARESFDRDLANRCGRLRYLLDEFAYRS